MNDIDIYEALEAVNSFLDDRLSEIEESAREGLQLEKLGSYNKNSKYDKAVRKMDVLRMQRKHGKLSDEEFKKKADELSDSSAKKFIGNRKYKWLTDKGSSEITEKLKKRPNKEPSTMKRSDFFNHGNNQYFDAKNIDPNTKEKINRHLSFMRSSDNEGEYKTHYDAIMKLIGEKNGKGKVLSPDKIQDENGFTGRVFRDKDTKPVSDEATKRDFIHTSPQKGLTKLNPTMRSTDNVFYPDKRIYFSTDKAMAKNGLGTKDLSQYKYIGSKRKDAKTDPEMNGSSAYISTKHPIKVDAV